MLDDFTVTKGMHVAEDRIQGLFHIPQGSPWFWGHFPSNPIFPAVGLIGLVDQTLHSGGREKNKRLSIRHLVRIRFRKIVQPGDDLSVTITPDTQDERGRHRFRIVRQTQLVSDGVVVTDDPSLETGPDDTVLEQRTLKEVDLGIEALIPHRDRMKLLDEVIGFDEGEYGVTAARTKETWPLCDGASVSPIITIELVAQSSAALVMWGLRETEAEPRLGYLVGIKKAMLSDEPIRVGANLRIITRRIVWRDNYGVFRGMVKDGNRTCGEVDIQVFRPDGT